MLWPWQVHAALSTIHSPDRSRLLKLGTARAVPDPTPELKIRLCRSVWGEWRRIFSSPTCLPSRHTSVSVTGIYGSVLCLCSFGAFLRRGLQERPPHVPPVVALNNSGRETNRPRGNFKALTAPVRTEAEGQVGRGAQGETSGGSTDSSHTSKFCRRPRHLELPRPSDTIPEPKHSCA